MHFFQVQLGEIPVPEGLPQAAVFGGTVTHLTVLSIGTLRRRMLLTFISSLKFTDRQFLKGVEPV